MATNCFLGCSKVDSSKTQQTFSFLGLVDLLQSDRFAIVVIDDERQNMTFPVASPNGIPPPPPPVTVVKAKKDRQPTVANVPLFMEVGGVKVDKLLVYLICLNLDPIDLFSFSCVCKMFYYVSNDDTVWDRFEANNNFMRALRMMKRQNLEISGKGDSKKRYLLKHRELLRKLNKNIICFVCTGSSKFDVTCLRKNNFFSKYSPTQRDLKYVCPSCVSTGHAICRNCRKTREITKKQFELVANESHLWYCSSCSNISTE